MELVEQRLEMFMNLLLIIKNISNSFKNICYC